MPSETVPCPRCAEPTPPVSDACEHCGGPLAPASDRRPVVAQAVLAFAVLGSGLATAIWLLVGGLLAATAARSLLAALAPATLCLLATCGLCVLYRRRYRPGRSG